jgi:hypothetical protein
VLAYAIAWVGWPLWASGVLAEPLFLPCGPLVAALVVIAVTEGKAGLRVLGAPMPVFTQLAWADLALLFAFT